MATVAVNVKITNTVSYTVPALKRLIGNLQALATGDGSAPNVLVNGTVIGIMSLSATLPPIYSFPIAANAGDVITYQSSTGVGLSGQLFDA